MEPSMKRMTPPALRATSPRLRVGRHLASTAMLALLSACSDSPPPALPPGGPDDSAAPSAHRPYQPVMAGTVMHGIGERP